MAAAAPEAPAAPVAPTAPTDAPAAAPARDDPALASVAAAVAKAAALKPAGAGAEALRKADAARAHSAATGANAAKTDAALAAANGAAAAATAPVLYAVPTETAAEAAAATDELRVNTKGALVTRYGPGLVLIQNAFDESAQRWLARYAMRAGADPKTGFWVNQQTAAPNGVAAAAPAAAAPAAGAGAAAAAAGAVASADGKSAPTVGPTGGTMAALNATPGRGRIYQVLTRYADSERIKGMCLSLVALAKTQAEQLPDMNATHLLLLYYANAQGMAWHRDSDKNDGDNDHPIVSVSLGNSSQFGYKQLLKAEATLTLQSGDVLVWGGPERMLLHQVAGVAMGTCPAHLRPIVGDARINFTFRSAPNILGKEEQFATDKYWVDPSTK